MQWPKWAQRMLGRSVSTGTAADRAAVKRFRKRYAAFRKLLDANAALAEVMADLEEKLRGTSLFGIVYVRSSAQRAVALTRRMVTSLNKMHPGAHAGLEERVNAIEDELHRVLSGADANGEQQRNLTMPFSEIDVSMVDWVGGKSANLGEMVSMAGVPVPRGFAVTIAACHLFFTRNGLDAFIEGALARSGVEDREALMAALEEIRGCIEEAPLPEELETEIRDMWEKIFGAEPVRVAVRSSAQVEDGEKSFAGQFLTELGVTREQVADSYKKVVASLFTPSATIYRLHQGIPLTAYAMGVALVEMVAPVASGIAYSHDPVNLMADTLIINSIWGQGRYLVDGVVAPDMWVFTREDPPILARRRAAQKERMLVSCGDGELCDAPVPAEMERTPSLTDQEAAELAAMVLRLEAHYGSYQDIEWAKTADRGFVFLQSRPLGASGGTSNTPVPPRMKGYHLILEGGDAAYKGIGCGVVVAPRNQEDLLNFPTGGVLVARHSSADYAAVMDRAQAIVTETGGVTGHMATISREFRVPTLLNLPGALEKLPPGIEVTVDAFSGRVYAGKVKELLPLRMDIEPVRLMDTPVYELLRQAARLIVPLNLIDPGAAQFTPAGCKTLHDVMRYVHEFSYHEMFAISDVAVQAGQMAMKLKAPLPIDLHIIDLDRGTTREHGSSVVRPEDIRCVPLCALLRGMLRPEVMFRQPRPVNMKGFMSVMGQQMVQPQGVNNRFGDRSYAIISDRYMNFSSRVGYHYSVIDAYCGQTTSKNYISFNFQGGAAGEVRRVRRCRAIGLVLEALGFQVILQGDLVKSRFQKYPREQIEDRLDQLGRLLQVTRQMDMLMVDDAAILQFRNDFLKGVYR